MKPLELKKPYLLVVVGLPGVGKSFFAKGFSEAYGAPFVDYVHFHQVAGNEELGDVVATELLGQLFITRRTILVEGRGETKQDRAILIRLAASKGYEILFVWIQTEPNTAFRRAVTASGQPYSSHEYESRMRSFALLERAEPHMVVSGKYTFPMQARMIVQRISTSRQVAKPRTATATKSISVTKRTRKPRITG